MGVIVREVKVMKKRISSAFDEMALNFGYIASVWFVMWAFFPNVLDNWSRPELLWLGSLMIGVGLFKGYRDQVKKDKAASDK